MRPEIILYFFVQKRCSVRAGIVIARLSGLASANRVRHDCTNTIGVKLFTELAPGRCNGDIGKHNRWPAVS